MLFTTKYNVLKAILLKFTILLMFLNINGCVGFFITSILAGGTIAIIADSRDIQTANDDHALRHQIAIDIKKDPELVSSNISVSSFHKIVLLTGQAPNALLKVKAEKIAKTFTEVNRIYNEISIGKNIPMKSQSKDVWLTTKIKSILVAKPGVKSGSIKIVTENSNVYLMGYVTKQQANDAVQIVRKISGVKKVIKAFKYLVIKEEHQLKSKKA